MKEIEKEPKKVKPERWVNIKKYDKLKWRLAKCRGGRVMVHSTHSMYYFASIIELREAGWELCQPI